MFHFNSLATDSQIQLEQPNRAPQITQMFTDFTVEFYGLISVICGKHFTFNEV